MLLGLTMRVKEEKPNELRLGRRNSWCEEGALFVRVVLSVMLSCLSEGFGWCVVLLKRHSSIARRPGRTCQHVRCSRLPPHYFRGSIRPTRHCPRSIPGAKPANNLDNLPEQGLTLLKQPKL